MDDKPDESPDREFEKLLHEYQDAIEAREFDDATAAVYDIFAHAAEWSEQNPSTDSDLFDEASRCEELGDWHGAESAYRAILALPDLAPMIAYRAHSYLGSLYHLLNRSRDAAIEVSRATAEARRADVQVLLAMALADEAHILIVDGRFDEAAVLIAEGLSIVAGDAAYAQIHARFLILRARCAVHGGHLSPAQRDLDQAFELLKPLSKLEIAAGAHRDVSRWWSATAALRTKQQNPAGAVTAWQQAVAISKHVASLPQAQTVYTQAALAKMLTGLADAYSAAGRHADAKNALSERTTILKRARLDCSP